MGGRGNINTLLARMNFCLVVGLIKLSTTLFILARMVVVQQMWTAGLKRLFDPTSYLDVYPPFYVRIHIGSLPTKLDSLTSSSGTHPSPCPFPLLSF